MGYFQRFFLNTIKLIMLYFTVTLLIPTMLDMVNPEGLIQPAPTQIETEQAEVNDSLTTKFQGNSSEMSIVVQSFSLIKSFMDVSRPYILAMIGIAFLANVMMFIFSITFSIGDVPPREVERISRDALREARIARRSTRLPRSEIESNSSVADALKSLILEPRGNVTEPETSSNDLPMSKFNLTKDSDNKIGLMSRIIRSSDPDRTEQTDNSTESIKRVIRS